MSMGSRCMRDPIESHRCASRVKKVWRPIIRPWCSLPSGSGLQCVAAPFQSFPSPTKKPYTLCTHSSPISAAPNGGGDDLIASMRSSSRPKSLGHRHAVWIACSLREVRFVAPGRHHWVSLALAPRPRRLQVRPSRSHHRTRQPRSCGLGPGASGMSGSLARFRSAEPTTAALCRRRRRWHSPDARRMMSVKPNRATFKRDEPVRT
jgi:hypothetical protein